MSHGDGGGGLVVEGKVGEGENAQKAREMQTGCDAKLMCVENSILALDAVTAQVDVVLGLQTVFQTDLEGFRATENVLVAVRKAAFDAQVSIGAGAFCLHSE